MSFTRSQSLTSLKAYETSFPRVYSFYILEGETLVTMQLIALKNLDDKRPITTLLRKDSPISSLRGLCVLVLLKGSDIVQVEIKPAVPQERSQLWEDHVYNCGQVQDLIAMKTPIDKWVSEVTEPDEQMDAFRRESVVDWHQSTDVRIIYKEPLSPTKKPSTKRVRTARGIPDALNNAVGEPQNGYDDKEAIKKAANSPADGVSTGKASQSYYKAYIYTFISR